MENIQRIFKGIWIPAEIYENKNLSWTEKILFAEIDSLDSDEGCFASNQYFADFLGVTEKVISSGISKLKDLGLIETVAFDGRRRVLKVKADWKKTSRKTRRKVLGRLEEKFQHNNIDYNIEDKKREIVERKKADFNYFVDSWNNALVVNCSGLSKIATFGPERIRKLDDLVNAVIPVMKTLGVKEKKPERFILKTVQKEYMLSDYLSGKSTKKNAINVDFVLTTEYFMKLLEGYYRTEQN